MEVNKATTGQNFNPKEGDVPSIQVHGLSNKFPTMDFSFRDQINFQILKNLQENENVTMTDLTEEHVDRADSRRMMRDIFPPEDYGYGDLKELPKGNDEKYYQQVNELLTQYASQPTSDNFRLELQLRQTQDELEREKRAFEDQKIQEVKNQVLKEKVKNQRKARAVAKKERQELEKQREEEIVKQAQEERKKRIDELQRKTEERRKKIEARNAKLAKKKREEDKEQNIPSTPIKSGNSKPKTTKKSKEYRSKQK